MSVGTPDTAGRRRILAIHTREMPLTAGAQAALGRVANETGGFTGADLMHVAREAGLGAVRRVATAAGSGGDVEGLDASTVAVEAEDVLAALRQARPSALRDMDLREAGLPWDQLVGLDDIKALLIEHAQRVIRGEGPVAGRQGILLYGPTGNGKSVIARALPAATGANLVTIERARIFNQWLGESEEALRTLFRRAIQTRPAILLLEHIEALAPARRGSSGERTDERVISALLASIDEAVSEGGVLVVGLTNRPEDVDASVIRPGRLGLHVEFANPDASRRARLAETAAAEAGVHLTDQQVLSLVERTEGQSAAHVVTVTLAEPGTRQA
jgi:transitional endoplasmic reticulum ATPase